jgi:uncharacterized protein YfiM (DUF2279 family)
MNLESVLVLLLLGGAPEAPPTPGFVRSEPVQGWFTEDKLKHFFASFVVSSVSASVSRAAGLDRTASIGFGAGVGAAAGLLKERQDARAGGVFSGADLVWDAAGIGASLMLIEAAE